MAPLALALSLRKRRETSTKQRNRRHRSAWNLAHPDSQRRPPPRCVASSHEASGASRHRPTTAACLDNAKNKPNGSACSPDHSITIGRVKNSSINPAGIETRSDENVSVMMTGFVPSASTSTLTPYGPSRCQSTKPSTNVRERNRHPKGPIDGTQMQAALHRVGCRGLA